MSQKLLIFGMGAIGSVFALFSRKAGYEVHAIARPAHATAIQRKGLKLTGIFGEHSVQLSVFTSIQELPEPDFDLILITTKAYDTESAAHAVAPFAAKAKAVVSLQNGLFNDRKLEQFVPAEKVYLGRVIFGAERQKPGQVRATVMADATRIGHKEGREEPLLKEWAEKVSKAGLPIQWSDNVLFFIYHKALYNCALNPLGTLLRTTYGSLADDPHCREIMNMLLRECFAVMQKKSIPFPVSYEEYLRVFYEELLPPTRAHYPSMLRDIEQRGKSEIKALNGAFVKLGYECGIEVPFNRGLTWLIQALQEKAKKA